MSNNINQAELLSWANSHSDSLSSIKNWVTDFLCKPNPLLGRSGAVCPFASEAIRRDSIFFTIDEANILNFDREMEKLIAQIQQFKELKVNNADDYKVIMNAYPYVVPQEYEKIELLQKRLKPLFVEESLMIGQFYPGCREKALWNNQFFPLDSPICLLVIRHMAITDIAFLTSEPAFLNKYMNVFGEKGEIYYNKFLQYKTPVNNQLSR
jgi:hypothetical protein